MSALALPTSKPSEWIGLVALGALIMLMAIGGRMSFSTAGQVKRSTQIQVQSDDEFWNGILAPERAYDWTLAGIPGGIPSRTTVCATVNSGQSNATIQAAIDSCPDNQVVFFSAGTYNLPDGLTVNDPIVLRGAGPNDTLINLSGSNIFLGCCGSASGFGLGGYPTGVARKTWSGGLTHGSTQLTLNNTTDLTAGMGIILDETNRSWIYTTGQSGTVGSAGVDTSDWDGSVARAASQMTKIVSVDSSTQITIRDPVAYTHVSGSTPQVYYWTEVNLEYAGVEDMWIDAGGVSWAIGLTHCDYCWVKNVAVDNIGRTAFNVRNGYGMEVRDSYIASVADPGPTLYGVECFRSSNSLIENNITFNVVSPMQIQNCHGSVFAYNYIQNIQSGNLYPELDTHGVHNQFLLYEGNDADKIQYDNVWGSASHSTSYRNRADGAGSGQNKTGYRTPIVVGAHQLFINLVANVAGDTSRHTVYQCDNSNTMGGTDTYVFDQGFWNGCVDGTTSYDSNVLTSTMKWGNWDSATGAAQYCTAAGGDCPRNERGDTDATYPALTSPSSTFPASFYLTSAPAFMGSVPWPPIGPDVTCSSNCVSNAGSHAHKIPARLCYEALPKDGSGYLTEFDAADCYPAP